MTEIKEERDCGSYDGHEDINQKVNTSSFQDENILAPEVLINSCLEKPDYGYCDKCQTCFYLLKSHEAVFHNNKEEVRCTFCGQLFLKRSKLIKHIFKEHETSHIRCHYCNKEDFAEYENLFVHLEEHMFLHIYFCHICHETFALKSNLDDHLTSHLSSWKQPFLECPNCDRRFESNKKGVRRIKKHWVQDHSKHFKCKHCKKQFDKFIVFYHHCLRHSKKLPYICNECGLGFRKKCRLREHLETTHWNKFHFKCSICDVEFKYQSTFDAHVRSHNESLRFTCNYCAKLFIRKISLLDHFVEKSCSLCEEEFHCKTTFDRHFELYHRTDPMFACDECSKTYFLENALKRHKTIVHPKRGEQIYRCLLCCYETINLHNLNRHKRRSHRN